VKLLALSQHLPVHHEQAVVSLRDLSARVGSDPLLVQASNGNTSIKLDGILWLKASGKWLARALQDDMFVPLELAAVRDSIQNATGPFPGYVQESVLRPSIETPMHAILRHRVVIHVHSINTIAWAIRLDGPAQLKQRLDPLHWQWIPYAASGIPLARAIESAMALAPDTDVLILGNHGLVVCGPDCDSAEKLLFEVERRLVIAPRPFPKPDTAVLGAIARSSSWQFPDVDSLHSLATDEVSLRILKGGVLYPCQAIFLGHTMPLLPLNLLASKMPEPFNSRVDSPPFVAVERSGVMLNKKMTIAERATLLGLAQVTQRTDASAKLRYLQGDELANVLNLDAHGYKNSPALAV
jgi:rhamnose utilization protein RhaD (predicted bifunctional aldolase and dehydrogenase)